MKTRNSHQRVIKFRPLLAAIILSCFAVQVTAEDIIAYRPAFDQDNNWDRASDEELDALRGGFILPNGMRIDLNLEKIVLLNGNEIFSSFFQLPEDALMLQNGVRNMVSDSITTPALSSFIQNTLDHQQIRTVTEINIEISNIQNMELNNSNHRVYSDFILPGLQ
jgi:hypothetical protein